eukprot:scaffold10825_cov153-Amphora_coffeaeformis.AAC.5
MLWYDGVLLGDVVWRDVLSSEQHLQTCGCCDEGIPSRGNARDPTDPKNLCQPLFDENVGVFWMKASWRMIFYEIPIGFNNSHQQTRRKEAQQSGKSSRQQQCFRKHYVQRRVIFIASSVLLTKNESISSFIASSLGAFHFCL